MQVKFELSSFKILPIWIMNRTFPVPDVVTNYTFRNIKPIKVQQNHFHLNWCLVRHGIRSLSCPSVLDDSGTIKHQIFRIAPCLTTWPCAQSNGGNPNKVYKKSQFASDICNIDIKSAMSTLNFTSLSYPFWCSYKHPHPCHHHTLCNRLPLYQFCYIVTRAWTNSEVSFAMACIITDGQVVRGVTCHELEVMSSNPIRIELWGCSTSKSYMKKRLKVPSCTLCSLEVILIYQGVHCCTKVCKFTDLQGSDTTWELRMPGSVLEEIYAWISGKSIFGCI